MEDAFSKALSLPNKIFYFFVHNYKPWGSISNFIIHAILSALILGKGIQGKLQESWDRFL